MRSFLGESNAGALHTAHVAPAALGKNVVLPLVMGLTRKHHRTHHKHRHHEVLFARS